MRTRSPLVVLAVALAALIVFPSVASAQVRGIEKPVRGKKYPLSAANGPWMIMVASFNEPPPERRTEGMTPEQAAEELVFELRSHGVPAYTYALDDRIETLETVDRLGEPERRVYAAQRGSICVLAGNYQSIDADNSHLSGRAKVDAQTSRETLKWIKGFPPKFLSGGESGRRGLVALENGGIYQVTPGQKGPLEGAFFTTNPLKSAEEIRAQSPERLDLLVKLNAGGDCSLYENKGKYTLVIASFYGRSSFADKPSEVTNFDLSINQSAALNQASQDAWELAQYMRQLKYDAYVWHDRYKSVVTVGSFETTDDRRIPGAVATYSAKMKPHANKNSQILTAEYLTMPLAPAPGQSVQKRWIFDPEPKLMKVPKRR